MRSTSARDKPGESATAAFGFREVPADARQGLVNDVFSSVAGRYDLMNDLMSGGLHRLWKDDLVAWLAPPKSARRFDLIDEAGGTGDIAQRVLEAGGPGCTAVLCDINPAMVEVGRKRLSAARLGGRVTFAIGNAEALPFPDKSFDAYTIAFGIRNVTHIDRALAEAYRVLKTGGRFLCLEFSACEVPLLDRLYDFHSFEVIPRLGALAAGSAEPYRYLVESIRKFPRQEPFADLIRAAGFARVSWRNLTGGIAAMHSGWRI
jgi:demethylmenaquinone methyltransferase/2-methoxy-6-polyprenyl-1,4-benzoquinol methylase